MFSMEKLHHFPPINTSLECWVIEAETIRCSNVTTDLGALEHPVSPNDRLFWVYLFVYLILVLIAGLMSGLTLAILSLDVTGLKVLLLAGGKSEKKHAKRIMPFARKHHLVLVVLVLANSLAVEAMPLFLDRITNPLVAITVSTTAVLIFGEVLPQAVCSRYGLAIGYYFSWLVWSLIGLFFIIAWPMSKLLDLVLGKDHGTFYRRAELQALVDMHGPPKTPVEGEKSKNGTYVTRSESSKDECLTLDEVLIMKGALSLAAKEARHAMTPLAELFMLPADRQLDRATLQLVLDSGRSRIPIYDGQDRSKIVGVLLAKKLILWDASEAKTLRQIIEENSNTCVRRAFLVPENKPMYELLNDFQTGYNTHIAFVTKLNEETKKEEIQGIVTMEAILEQLLQEQIYDESDALQFASAKAQMARENSRMSNRQSSPPIKKEEKLKPLLMP